MPLRELNRVIRIVEDNREACRVAGVVMGNTAVFGGVAPDARFINARVLGNDGSFATSAWVRNGVGFAIEEGADILNLSLNRVKSNGPLAKDSGPTPSALMPGLP